MTVIRPALLAAALSVISATAVTAQRSGGTMGGLPRLVAPPAAALVVARHHHMDSGAETPRIASAFFSTCCAEAIRARRAFRVFASSTMNGSAA